MNCIDIGFGTYECSYNIMVPWLCKLPYESEEMRVPKYISVDKCMLSEIIGLWEMGIKTTGCCCGHGKEPPFISVGADYVEQMERLGYAHLANTQRADDNTCFTPMRCPQYGEIKKGFNWWDNVLLTLAKR